MSKMNIMEMDCITEVSTCKNCLSVTRIFPNREIKNVILIKTVHYIEIWDERIVSQWRQNFMKGLLETSDENQKIKYRNMLSKVSAIKVDGCREIIEGSCHNRMICLTKEVVEQYGLENGAVVEGRGTHVRLWNPFKFETYQEELKNQKTREMFLQKVNVYRKRKSK